MSADYTLRLMTEAVRTHQTLAWSLAHYRDSDPLRVAWRETWNDGRMILLLGWARHPRFEEAKAAWSASVAACGCCTRGPDAMPVDCWWCADAIRRVVPELSTPEVVDLCRVAA